MSPTLWIVGAAIALVALGLLQLGVRRLIGRMEQRLGPRDESDDPTWAEMLVERERHEGAAFESDLVYWSWPIALGSAFAVAAAIGAWGAAWVILGLFLALFALAALMPRIKYGTAKLRDVLRLLRREPRA